MARQGTSNGGRWPASSWRAAHQNQTSSPKRLQVSGTKKPAKSAKLPCHAECGKCIQAACMCQVSCCLLGVIFRPGHYKSLACLHRTLASEIAVSRSIACAFYVWLTMFAKCLHIVAKIGSTSCHPIKTLGGHGTCLTNVRARARVDEVKEYLTC